LILRYGVKINSKLDCSRAKDGKHVLIVYRRWFVSANILNPHLHVQSIAMYQQNRKQGLCTDLYNDWIAHVPPHRFSVVTVDYTLSTQVFI